MDKYGDYFEPGLENLDQLMESLAKRMAQMQSLMDSMPGNMRNTLEQMLQQMLGDSEMQGLMSELMANMEAMMPMRQMRGRYPFGGDESMSLEQAMQMMQQMDELERQLKRAHDGESMDQIDPQRLGDLLGPEARAQFEQLQQITKIL